MNIRKVLIGSAVVIIGLPMLLSLTAVVFISILNRTNGAIVSSGQKREYLLHAPPSYDRTKPTPPLVISMHAAALWPAAQMATSQWNEVADQEGFIVVYPAGRFGKLASRDGLSGPQASALIPRARCGAAAEAAVDPIKLTL